MTPEILTLLNRDVNVMKRLQGFYVAQLQNIKQSRESTPMMKRLFDFHSARARQIRKTLAVLNGQSEK